MTIVSNLSLWMDGSSWMNARSNLFHKEMIAYLGQSHFGTLDNYQGLSFNGQNTGINQKNTGLAAFCNFLFVRFRWLYPIQCGFVYAFNFG
ncbi:MAG: hypothetical protein AUK63_43 [bacterium P3]|nr:MAG: hypothetical protein AUK63_43 [bacterium P3]